MTINVLPPVVVYEVFAVNDSYVGSFGQPFTPLPSALLLRNDNATSPSPQLAVVSSSASLVQGSGSVSGITPNGSFTFTPAQGFFGECPACCVAL